jgi:hypothetical protein
MQSPVRDKCSVRNEVASLALGSHAPVESIRLVYDDPYGDEARPMGWRGLGPQPLLHVDAK